MKDARRGKMAPNCEATSRRQTVRPPAWQIQDSYMYLFTVFDNQFAI